MSTPKDSTRGVMRRRTHGNLLIDDEPLQLLPDLAVVVGLNEAIILQQIHYWLHPRRNSGLVVDGVRWIYNSYPQWQEQFPFWTTKVIGNTIRSLEKQGILLSRQDLNAKSSDRSKWYTIDYDHPILTGSMHSPDWDHDRPAEDVARPGSDNDYSQTGPSSTAETTSEITQEDKVEKRPPIKPADLRDLDPVRDRELILRGRVRPFPPAGATMEDYAAWDDLSREWQTRRSRR